MLARKGVLISNPDVEKMTEAMWMFEALALRERDKQEKERLDSYFKVGVRLFRQTLIKLLGLDRGLNKLELGVVESDPDAPMPFVPFVFFAGRPDAVKHIMEKEDEAERMGEAVNDKGFDELSEQLAKADIGDMMPLLDEFKRLDSDQAILEDAAFQNMMKSLGVVISDDPALVPPTPPKEKR